MSGNYVLDGKVPVPCDDILKWARRFEAADRTVAKTDIGGLHVSTVFLGIDHGFSAGPPILFETMVFGLPDDEERMKRYETWEQAEQGHAEIVKEIQGASRRPDNG